jgi:hypothetical protein
MDTSQQVAVIPQGKLPPLWSPVPMGLSLNSFLKKGFTANNAESRLLSGVANFLQGSLLCDHRPKWVCSMQRKQGHPRNYLILLRDRNKWLDHECPCLVKDVVAGCCRFPMP